MREKAFTFGVIDEAILAVAWRNNLNHLENRDARELELFVSGLS